MYIYIFSDTIDLTFHKKKYIQLHCIILHYLLFYNWSSSLQSIDSYQYGKIFTLNEKKIGHVSKCPSSVGWVSWLCELRL